MKWSSSWLNLRWASSLGLCYSMLDDLMGWGSAYAPLSQPLFSEVEVFVLSSEKYDFSPINVLIWLHSAAPQARPAARSFWRAFSDPRLQTIIRRPLVHSLCILKLLYVKIFLLKEVLSVWSVACGSLHCSCSRRKKTHFLVSLPILSYQDTELYKEAVLSAPVSCLSAAMSDVERRGGECR